MENNIKLQEETIQKEKTIGQLTVGETNYIINNFCNRSTNNFLNQ